MGADDPRTKTGNEPYQAPNSVARPAPTPVGARDKTLPGPAQPLSSPDYQPKDRSHNAPAPFGPVHPDTNKRNEEAPAGSSTTPVPQQIPKGTPSAKPSAPDKV